MLTMRERLDTYDEQPADPDYPLKLSAVLYDTADRRELFDWLEVTDQFRDLMCQLWDATLSGRADLGRAAITAAAAAYLDERDDDE